jgi:tetratricopeptide (TPR) repeat protein
MILKKWSIYLLLLSLIAWVNACKQDSKSAVNAEKAKEVPNQVESQENAYAVTVDGKKLLAIPEPDSIMKKNKADMDAARMNYLGHLSEVKPYLNYGAQCLNSGIIEVALQVLGKGIEEFPNTADLYFYRGVAAVQGRQFPAAINDFWKAGKGVEGQKNVKGLMDKTAEEKKIDASLHYDIYKWMGLAFQCQGDFSNAEKMFEVCGDFSTNSDLYCMSYYWQYQSYKRSGRVKDADRILESVDAKMFITPVTKPYLDALLYYKGSLSESELVDFNKLPQSSTEGRDWTIKAYAVAVKAFLQNDQDKFKQTLQKIVDIPYWNQMAYIAAEADLHRIIGYDYKQMETKELAPGERKQKDILKMKDKK